MQSLREGSNLWTAAGKYVKVKPVGHLLRASDLRFRPISPAYGGFGA